MMIQGRSTWIVLEIYLTVCSILTLNLDNLTPKLYLSYTSFLQPGDSKGCRDSIKPQYDHADIQMCVIMRCVIKGLHCTCNFLLKVSPSCQPGLRSCDRQVSCQPGTIFLL